LYKTVIYGIDLAATSLKYANDPEKVYNELLKECMADEYR